MNRQINLMIQESLQMDFHPQPSGIVVITSAPISAIVEGGNYSAFQDLIDGYASSFAKVFVLSPSGESGVVPNKAHRVTWFSGPSWLSQTQGLLWATHVHRRDLKHVELIRSFGPRAGAVGRVLKSLSKSQHVASADDLVGNSWRKREGWRAFLPKLITQYGVLGADVVSATFDWELELLAGSKYENDLLLGSVGLPTDIYTPVSLTDPNRHPVVLWAGNVADEESISVLREAALSTRKMIDNVEFVAVVPSEVAERLRTTVNRDDLPVTVVGIEEVEPLVDLIERTWACVTLPNRGYPHGLAMLALSAGIPLISSAELKEERGFKSHLNYVGIDSTEQGAVAHALQLMWRWGSFAHRIGSAGQRLIEEQFSTRAVALKEGERLARIATDQSIEPETASAAATLSELVSDLFGDSVVTDEEGSLAAADSASVEETIQDVSEGFDLVAAAIAAANELKSSDLIASAPAKAQVSEDANDGGIEGADLVAALFDETPETPETELISAGGPDDAGDELPEITMVKVNADDVPPGDTGEEASGDMGQDAISALFAANNGEMAPVAEPEPEPVLEVSGDMGQDAISALFAADNGEMTPAAEPKPEPVLEVSGDMGQDAISALFAANNGESQTRFEAAVGFEPESTDHAFGGIGQDHTSDAFDTGGQEPIIPIEPEPVEESSGAMDQDAISALFGANSGDKEAA